MDNAAISGSTRTLRSRGKRALENVADGVKKVSKRRILGDVSNKEVNLVIHGEKSQAGIGDSKPKSTNAHVVQEKKAPLPKIRTLLGNVGGSGKMSKKNNISNKEKNVERPKTLNLSLITKTEDELCLKKDSASNTNSFKDVAQGTSSRLTRSQVKNSGEKETLTEASCSRSKSDDYDEINQKKKSRKSPATDIVFKDNIEASKIRGKQLKFENASGREVGKKPLEPKNNSNILFRELCCDFYKDKNHTLVRVPFDVSKFTAGKSKYEADRDEDESKVTEYVTDIYQRYYACELNFKPRMYMSHQEEINAMMRAILIDWLIEVHMKFKLVPETLYLCINIIDRYCSAVEVKRRKLQLVGVTALLIACKYEEIYPPEVRDCVYITDRAYTRQEVLDMEQSILKALEYRLSAPTAYSFLTRFLRIINASEILKAAANYYLERTLQEYEFLQFRASLVACSAVCLAFRNPQVLAEQESRTLIENMDGIKDYTKFSKKEIEFITSKIEEKIGEEVITASQRALLAVKKKYGTVKYFNVSSDVIEFNRKSMI